MRKGYSYDLPMFKARFEYFCKSCKRLFKCIDDPDSRNTCATCGSSEIIKGSIGSLIHLEHNSKEKKGK